MIDHVIILEGKFVGKFVGIAITNNNEVIYFCV